MKVRPLTKKLLRTIEKSGVDKESQRLLIKLCKIVNELDAFAKVIDGDALRTLIVTMGIISLYIFMLYKDKKNAEFHKMATKELLEAWKDDRKEFVKLAKHTKPCNKTTHQRQSTSSKETEKEKKRLRG